MNMRQMDSQQVSEQGGNSERNLELGPTFSEDLSLGSISTDPISNQRPVQLPSITHQPEISLEDFIQQLNQLSNRVRKGDCSLQKQLKKHILKRKRDDCSICQETMLRGEKVVRLTCNHYHHEICLNRWLKQNQICPLCRRRIE